eukprot:108814-Rhodomonas_salina.1
MGAMRQASECVKRAVVTVRNTDRVPREKNEPRGHIGFQSNKSPPWANRISSPQPLAACQCRRGTGSAAARATLSRC